MGSVLQVLFNTRRHGPAAIPRMLMVEVIITLITWHRIFPRPCIVFWVMSNIESHRQNESSLVSQKFVAK